MASLYQCLDVDRSASADDIKKAFRKKALVNHPDKGGDKAVFQQLQEAYSVLSDPAKRAEYDQTGQVPKEGGGPGPNVDLSELFGSMFGGGMPGFPGMPGMPGGFPGMFMHQQPQNQKAPRGPHKLHDIGLTLNDLYQGKTITLRFKRDVLCSSCDGKGGATNKCGPCGGRGIVMMQQQMGPMIAMTQMPCGACQQTGLCVTKACNDCGGKRVKEEETSLEGKVNPGMKDGDRIVFPGKCSESPQYTEPGDVILVIREVEHADFRRDGDNLTCDIQISMAESLLGFTRELATHPSGKPISVVSTECVRHGDTITVKGAGMVSTGSLIAKCVVAPFVFTETQKELLTKVFTVAL
jgi:DnaJ family protein A protein 2